MAGIMPLQPSRCVASSLQRLSVCSRDAIVGWTIVLRHAHRGCETLPPKDDRDGRPLHGAREVKRSHSPSSQPRLRIKEVSDKIWLVSFMDYDLGFFGHETGRLDSADNPFAGKVLPVSGINRYPCVRNGPPGLEPGTCGLTVRRSRHRINPSNQVFMLFSIGSGFWHLMGVSAL
jgi:hypothetical protein